MKRILLCAAVLFAALQVSAAIVDSNAAKEKAQRFIQSQLYCGGRFMAPMTGDLKLVHAEMNSKMLDRAVYYVFNTTNGYVIVSGDDRAEEILGYGDSPIDMNNIPCNMRAWLATYKEQLEYLQANEGLVVETPSMMAASMKSIPSVEPLLTALWDQEAPYWNMCKINNYQCLTGCPATSAAMVFYYWKYPDYLTSEVPGYRCYLSTGYYSGQYVSIAALPPVLFDWDHMRDSYSGSYTTEEANAVATLMRYVGQAERMEYGTSSAGGSGVSSDSVSLIADAFTFFGYDEETVRYVKKTSSYSGGTTLYTDAEWAEMIQEELNEGRPIVYCAIAGGMFGGGHAFNVDGYNASTNKYHVNFGWSGSSNNYYALNAFNGGGSTFNQYQQMVIGIQPPLKIPRLKANANELSMECYKNQTATAEFTLTGRNLENGVTITVNDENNVFSVSENAVEIDDDGRISKTITVTYAPKAEGEYTATVSCSAPGVDDVVITLHGLSVYELYRPVLLDLDESAVTATSFRADWADATPAENVASYTLEVRTKPDVALITEADWSNVPKDNTNHASDAANYLPEDWTFTGAHLYLDGGFISADRNSVFAVNCDMMGYSKVSVIIKAKAYEKGVSTTLSVATDLGEETLVLAKEVDTYLVVLDIGSDPVVRITTGYYPEIQSIKIYGGEITDPEPFALRGAVETGDASYLLIEGITPDKFYTVTGLTPATAYLYRVKSYYVNDTESSWSASKEVVLKESAGLIGDINNDGIVDVSDVTALINAVLTSSSEGVNMSQADVTGDGIVDVSDVTALIDLVLNGPAK